MLKIKNNSFSEEMWCSTCDYKGTEQLWDEDSDENSCPLCEETEDFLSLDQWQEGEVFYLINCPDSEDCEDCELYDSESHQDWIIKEFDKRFIGRTYQPTLPWGGYTIQNSKIVSDFPMGVTVNG